VSKRIREWLSANKALTPPDNWSADGTALAYAHPPKPHKEPRVYSGVTGQAVNFRQLLEALRSDAPGAWSDNRFEQTRHFVGITYVALRVICEMCAMSDIKVYYLDRNHPDGRHQAPHDDPLVELLENPNPDDTGADLLYHAGLQLGLTGTNLDWAVPNYWGQPVELYPISTALAIPLPSAGPQYPHGAYRIQPLYPYGPFSSIPTPSTGSGAIIPAEQFIKVKNPHPLLRYDGYSPLTAVRLQEDTVEAIDRGRFYTQFRGVDPTAVMEFDADVINPKPEDIDRLRAQFEALFSGPENVARLLLCMPGTHLKPYSQVPKDMAWQEGWSQLTSFMLSAWGVTKSVAGMSEDVSYATLYASLKQFHHFTLLPLLKRIAKQWTKHLASRFKSGGYKRIIEIEAPRIDDEELLLKRMQAALAAQCLTVDEYRVELGFKPTTEPWGKDRLGIPGSGQQQEMAMPGQQSADSGVPQDMLQPPELENMRPVNDQGAGSLGKSAKVAGPYRILQRANLNGNGVLATR